MFAPRPSSFLPILMTFAVQGCDARTNPSARPAASSTVSALPSSVASETPQLHLETLLEGRAGRILPREVLEQIRFGDSEEKKSFSQTEYLKEGLGETQSMLLHLQRAITHYQNARDLLGDREPAVKNALKARIAHLTAALSLFVAPAPSGSGTEVR